MIQQIQLPISYELSGYENQMLNVGEPRTTEQVNQKQEHFGAWFQEVEGKLDQALNEGFSIVAQYPTKHKSVNFIVFVMHKSEEVGQ